MPTASFNAGNIVYTQSDALSFLADIADDSVDLIILDPPYNMGKGDWDKFSERDEYFDFLLSVFLACERVLRMGGSLYAFNTPVNSAILYNRLESAGVLLNLENWITWDKKAVAGSSINRYKTAQETILFYTRGGEVHTFNVDAVREPYLHPDRVKSGIKRNGQRWFPNPLGRVASDVWDFTGDRHLNKKNGRTQKPKHPTIKPVALIERMVLASSNVGDLVVDPFLGSGTTLEACLLNKRMGWGCEISPEYIKVIDKRMLALQ